MTRLVTDYLDQSAQRFPDKIAFADEHREITFHELQQEAWHIADDLIRKELFKNPVAVFLDKSVECIAAFMGVAYSGNFYTPVDTKMPKARIEKILETLQPQAVITDRAHLDTVQAFTTDEKIILYEETMGVLPDQKVIQSIQNKVIDTDVLYVLFTSGSTGVPKGVIIPHRAVIDYIDWFSQKFEINEDIVLGNQAPLYFDLSIQDIYLPLKTGCTTRLIPAGYFAFPIKLMEYLFTKKINTIVWVPSALCLVANLKALKSKKIPQLKQILFCGEVMPNKQLNQWRRTFPHAIFVNLYGPTEVTEVCTYYPIRKPFKDEEVLPIGYPCQNSEVIVLNKNGKLVLNGEMGELCVRGTCLSYGYYNNQEKTKEAFVQNPLNHAYPEIIYRTGDLVRYNESGELLYVCRKDFQIKHMGHRIELGEIETAVSSIIGVDANCCLYDEDKAKIVLFYTGEIAEDELNVSIKELVPHYMVPSERKHLDAMPLNLNGKIDRVLLKTKL